MLPLRSKPCPANVLSSAPKKNLDPTISTASLNFFSAIRNVQQPPINSRKMPVDYDSDSSDGEYESTNVLLGYASKEAGDDTISHLGGHPVRWKGAGTTQTSSY